MILAASHTHTHPEVEEACNWPRNVSSASSNYFTSVSLVVHPFPLQLSIIYWPHPDVGFASNATGEIWKWVAPGARSA